MALIIRTSIHDAVRDGDLPTVERLSKQRQSLLRMKEFHGQTVLHVASSHGHVHIVKFLVNKGKGVVDVEALDVYGQTPLMLACNEGHVDVVRFLLEEVHTYGKRRYKRSYSTMLHRAAEHGHLNLVQYLVELSRRCRRRQCVTTMTETTENEEGNSTEARMGYDKTDDEESSSSTPFQNIHLSTDLFHETNRWGWTPLHSACSAVNDDDSVMNVVKYLVKQQVVEGATNLLKARTDRGETFLHFLCRRSGSAELVRYLLHEEEEGANVVENGNGSLSHSLLDHLLTIKTFSEGDTVLHVACKAKQWKTCLELLSLRRSSTTTTKTTISSLIHIKNAAGQTPLHCFSAAMPARSNDDTDSYDSDDADDDDDSSERKAHLVFEQLCASGDMFDAMEAKDAILGLTPFGMACLRGNLPLVRCFVQRYPAAVVETRTQRIKKKDEPLSSFSPLLEQAYSIDPKEYVPYDLYRWEYVVPNLVDMILNRCDEEEQEEERLDNSSDEEEAATQIQQRRRRMGSYNACIRMLLENNNRILEPSTAWRLWKRTMKTGDRIDKDNWNLAMDWVLQYNNNHRVSGHKHTDDNDDNDDDDDDDAMHLNKEMLVLQQVKEEDPYQYPLHAILSCRPLLKATTMIASRNNAAHDRNRGTKMRSFWKSVLQYVGPKSCMLSNSEHKVPLQIYLEEASLGLDLGMIQTLLTVQPHAAIFHEAVEEGEGRDSTDMTDQSSSIEENTIASLHPAVILCLQAQNGKTFVELDKEDARHDGVDDDYYDDYYDSDYENEDDVRDHRRFFSHMTHYHDEDDIVFLLNEGKVGPPSFLPANPGQTKRRRYEGKKDRILTDVLYRMIRIDPRRFVHQVSTSSLLLRCCG